MAKARKGQAGEVNKSEEVRQLLKANPEITATEAINTLAKRGITVASSQFYFAKGKMKGMNGRRRKIKRQVATVMSNGEMAATPAKSDVLATIRNVQGLATEVGGLWKLAAMV